MEEGQGANGASEKGQHGREDGVRRKQDRAEGNQRVVSASGQHNTHPHLQKGPVLGF